MQNNGITAHRGEDSHKEISKLAMIATALQKLKTIKKHTSSLIMLEQLQ